MLMTPVQPIVDACEGFWRSWCDRDIHGLIQRWDMDDPDSSYLPADSVQRHIGATAITAYLTRQVQTFPLIRMGSRLLRPRRLGDDLGAAFAVVDWARQGSDGSAPLGGRVRIVAVLRRRGDQWRLCHYAEAPLAPLVALRQFYQQIAADGHGSEA
jgi:hypothetical protein